MRRQSDIGWTELIIGIILIIFGLFIVRQPVGIITWIVIVCGVLAILRFYADRSSGCRNLGDCNDPSDLDNCTLCFQTFPSSVYENAFWNNLLLYFDDFEHSRIDCRIPAGIPADDHDLFHGSTRGCLSDP